MEELTRKNRATVCLERGYEMLHQPNAWLYLLVSGLDEQLSEASFAATGIVPAVRKGQRGILSYVRKERDT